MRIGYAAESQILRARLGVSAYFDYLRTLYERWDGALEQQFRRHFGLPQEQRIGRLSHGAAMKLKLAAALFFLDDPAGGA